MKSFAALSVLGACIAPALAGVLPRASGKLPPVTTKGNAFFAGDKRFYIRGVAYQPGGASTAADPLLDIKSLERDIKNFKELGINTIRVYTIDNSKNHDEAMKMLDDAGIYLALDANTPNYSLNRLNEASLHASYNDVYLQSVFATVDAFAGYNNLLVFFSGNEVINAKNNTNAATYIKAVTRDMKQYIKARSPRPIPVGYSSADVAENIEQQAHFFNCGSDDERADFFAFNDYSWCDPSSFTTSGWDKKVQTYKDYNIPLFLSEFGCITNTRQWNEIAALYSDKMTGVYSGGIVYEYSVEKNGYGIVEIDKSGSISPNDDFKRLAAAYKKTPAPSGDGGYLKEGSPSKCPPESDNWQVKTTLLPAIPEPAQKFMQKGAGTGPGLSEDSSQWAGTPSKTTATPGSGSSSSTPSPSGGVATGAAAEFGAVPMRALGVVAAGVVFGMGLMF
ncbi:hypothetical protein GQ43DRAFT_139766 [Delitschia confertaspora ATCC 74209]|uniref:1,3-beta-glucanosyltransferase n=1 Tax=Delitschia confertaspora ATCC 74209 TaxID=1513339 RepID=A0A9P4MQ19_9PLEO|nr:hypothetical protein GQ43DRAFT_139766 [Delitschia confertaspora ATCC 74209]